MTIHAYASADHYVDHLAPIWLALPPSSRGRFYVGTAEALELTIRRHQIPAGDLVPAHPTAGLNLLLVASYRDEKRARARNVILLEHGAGQHYGTGDAGGGNTITQPRTNVVLFLAPNRTVADRNRPLFPNARIAVVGSPKLDRYTSLSGRLELARRRSPSASKSATVAVAFHWDCTVVPESRTAFPEYQRHLGLLVDTFGAAHVLGHGHPRAWLQLPLEDTYRRFGIIPVRHLDDVLPNIDLFIADNTSALYEAAALDIPTVALNASFYRRDVNHGLRFWSAIPGVQCDGPLELIPAAHQALTDPPDLRRRRQNVARAVYAHLDGTATRLAVEEVIKCEHRTHAPSAAPPTAHATEPT